MPIILLLLYHDQHLRPILTVQLESSGHMLRIINFCYVVRRRIRIEGGDRSEDRTGATAAWNASRLYTAYPAVIVQLQLKLRGRLLASPMLLANIATSYREDGLWMFPSRCGYFPISSNFSFAFSLASSEMPGLLIVLMGHSRQSAPDCSCNKNIE